MAAMLESPAVDPHSYGVRRAAELLSGLCKRQPGTGMRFALRERLLNARLDKCFQAGMSRELLRELIEEPFRPCGAHAILRASGRGGRLSSGVWASRSTGSVRTRGSAPALAGNRTARRASRALRDTASSDPVNEIVA